MDRHADAFTGDVEAAHPELEVVEPVVGDLVDDLARAAHDDGHADVLLGNERVRVDERGVADAVRRRLDGQVRSFSPTKG